jgi:hypothetical protein
MLQLAARSLNPVGDDAPMIERERQSSGQHIIGPPPACAGGVGAGYRVG